MNCRHSPFFFLAVLGGAACYSSSATDDDARNDAPPGDTSHEAADADADADADGDGGGPDLPDVRPDVVPDGAECVVDDDCVVVLSEERCCDPDPQAVPRAALAADRCLHELGTAWSTTSPECWRECYACTPIHERFYAARCISGQCVGVEDFCAPMTAPASVGIFDATVVPRGGWEQYRGQHLTLHGWPQPGPTSASCGDLPGPCADVPIQTTLACEFTVRGSYCGTPWDCGGTECAPACTPLPIFGALWLDGYVVDSDVGGWELWPTTDFDDCAPAGPNPEGAACTPGEDGECADGMYCHYWDDVLFLCAGECRHEGTECTVDPDCGDGRVCYHGWCEWCCPG